MFTEKLSTKTLRGCQEYANIRNNLAKVPLHRWDELEHNRQRIHIDYAGPVQSLPSNNRCKV